MLAKEVMTKGPLLWCEAAESCQAAAKMMKEYAVGFIPVLADADSRKVVGVVTDRDICTRVIAQGLDPRFVTVRECMTTQVITCSGRTGVKQILEMMRKAGVRRVPVTERNGQLAGVISMDDMVLHEAAEPKQLCAILKAIYGSKREKAGAASAA
jgi:CBS domain-containing protein